MWRSFLVSAVLFAGLVPAACPTALADTLPLYGTGVDDANLALPGGAADPHFFVLETGDQAVVLSSLWSQWVPNDTNSAWIGWIDDPFPPTGTFTYRTTFDLTGYDPSTAVLTGDWAADQFGHIVLNGVDTGVSLPDGNWDGGQHPNLNPLVVSGGFIDGINVLDFVVVEPDGYDGLRVRNLAVSADPVGPR